MPKTYRQGDVLLIRVDSLPTGLREIPRDRGRVVLAYGETTGHAHAIEAPSVRFFGWQPAGAVGSKEAAREVIFNSEAEVIFDGARPVAARPVPAPAPTDRYLDVPVPAKLNHEEHGSIDIAPGKYRVVQQREYAGPAWDVPVRD
jgi:hypothetical protein